MDIAVRDISQHQSSREGARIHGAVLHTTEGPDAPEGNSDLITLGNIFHNEEASANFGVNVAGKFGEYVSPLAKAWAQCNFNQVMISCEQIAFAAYSKETWFDHRHDQLHGAAEFLVYSHIHWGVPLQKGKVSGSSIVVPGVFQHGDLGISGSGHTDCGPGYPEGYVILLAKFFIAHQLHPSAPHTERLRKEINNIRHVHGVTPIPVHK